jgi:hypothetical protein
MFTDDRVLSLFPKLEGIVVWVSLIVSADTAGRTEGDPVVICKTVLSELSEIFTPEIVKSLLEQMAEQKMIHWYQVGNRHHVEILQWRKHQAFRLPPVSDRPSPPIVGEEHITPPPPLPPQKKEEPTARDPLSIVINRIAIEFPDPDGKRGDFGGHNLFALAARTFNAGVRDEEQIVEILKSVRQNHRTIRNVWAYIQTAGLINTALSKAVETKSTIIKSEEAAGERGGMQSLGDILRKVSENMR